MGEVEVWGQLGRSWTPVALRDRIGGVRDLGR